MIPQRVSRNGPRARALSGADPKHSRASRGWSTIGRPASLEAGVDDHRDAAPALQGGPTDGMTKSMSSDFPVVRLLRRYHRVQSYRAACWGQTLAVGSADPACRVVSDGIWTILRHRFPTPTNASAGWWSEELTAGPCTRVRASWNGRWPDVVGAKPGHQRAPQANGRRAARPATSGPSSRRWPATMRLASTATRPGPTQDPTLSCPTVPRSLPTPKRRWTTPKPSSAG